MMRKILFSMIASLAIAGCSGNDDSTEIAISDEVHFLKDNISLKLGESILLDASRSIKECNLSVKDEFYTSISINGNDAKLITNKVGSTEIYIKYRDAKDTCTVTINPKTSKFGNPVLTLGATRDYVEDQMINYQHVHDQVDNWDQYSQYPQGIRIFHSLFFGILNPSISQLQH